MFKWLAKLEMRYRVYRQNILSDQAHNAIVHKDWNWYDTIRNKRAKNEARYLKLKDKFSL